MMRKIFVFLPDGVGLRNFAFTNFIKKGNELGCKVVFWNNTSFDLESEFNYNEIKINNCKLHPFTTIYKRAKIRVELNIFAKKFKDKTYLTYNFSQNYRGFKNLIKSLLVDLLVLFNNNQRGLERLHKRIDKIERSTDSYKRAKEQLLEEKPEMVFCTNQRPSEAIAPILAAKDIGVKTATFIFSWDNLPKATKIIDTDYYFVWSDFMKTELLKYYPQIRNNQIKVTGTPQFESHFNESLLISRNEFCKEFNLDVEKKYICFSGDDITTSPFDEFYLKDLAEAVRSLNHEGHNYGIIFRKCPVDFTGRYNFVLDEFKDLIISIDPLWEKKGEVWNTIMPTKADLSLLVNTINNCEFVVNIASSMVFDFACFDKVCIYPNYEQPFLKKGDKTVKETYNYIHFNSMPQNNAVVWVKNKKELKEVICNIESYKKETVSQAKKWFTVINGNQPKDASLEIWKGIQSIIN